MGVPEAGVQGEIAGSSKRSLEEPETERGHGRRQRLAHLDTGHRGQVIGELHRRGRLLQGSSVAVELCQFSIDEEGENAVSRKKWDFSKEEERAKFLADVDRRGPPVLWVHCQSRRRADSTQLSVAACTRQNRRRRFYVLQVPRGCDVDEKKELSKPLGEVNGKMCSMKSGTVLTNWNRMQAELEKEDVDVGDVRDLLTKLTETMRKKRSELQLHRDDGLELHECFSLDDLVVPLDLPEQWDERTGKALDMEKVVQGRLKELQKLKERGVYVHVPREDAMHGQVRQDAVGANGQG